MGIVEKLDRALYPEFEDSWDNKLFREYILTHLAGKEIVLDIGAGAGIVLEMDFKNTAAQICGVDLDPRVIDNPMLDEGKLADAVDIPYDDNRFDVVFSNNVMEHIAKPEKLFVEVHRVLKPGGIFLFKTPNKNHYVPLIARLTPYWFHQYFNKLRGRSEEDTFPTLYRANSVAAVKSLASSTKFQVIQLHRIEGRPEYLRFNVLTYLIGVTYERLVNSTEMLSLFRILLIAVLRKPPSD
jgi:SAM-dependent methyltransferase